MKLLSRSVLFVSILMFSLCLGSYTVNAQVGAPCGGPNDPCDPDTPVDGGLSVLIAAGVGYGVKKIRDERKKTLNKLP